MDTRQTTHLPSPSLPWPSPLWRAPSRRRALPRTYPAIARRSARNCPAAPNRPLCTAAVMF
eukprot:10991040-Lingulodinium_polyedra.AAC.1